MTLDTAENRIKKSNLVLFWQKQKGRNYEFKEQTRNHRKIWC